MKTRGFPYVLFPSLLAVFTTSGALAQDGSSSSEDVAGLTTREMLMPLAPYPSAQRPVSARAAANEDVTGWWVSYMSADWRWRMVTPPQQDLVSIPLNPEGIKFANAWDWHRDQSQENRCKPYGAAGLMRMPTRLHITWADDNTLRLETDTASQIRLFRFGGAAYAQGSAKSWQGVSTAAWESTALQASGLQILAIPPPPPSYSLRVVTTGMRAGYLRPNGVPYSENAVMTEYYDALRTGDGQGWLLLTMIVDDPEYLQQAYVTTYEFKHERDGSRWRPTGCEVVPPGRGPRAVSSSGIDLVQPTGPTSAQLLKNLEQMVDKQKGEKKGGSH